MSCIATPIMTPGSGTTDGGNQVDGDDLPSPTKARVAQTSGRAKRGISLAREGGGLPAWEL